MIVIRWLSRLLPRMERRDWIREWEGEFEHQASMGRSRFGLMLTALEDALRRRAATGQPTFPLRDLALAFRGLRRNRLYTLLAVLTLALGLGANTAIYSVVHATMVRDLPLPNAEEVQVLLRSGVRYQTTSAPNYLDIKEEAQMFSGVSAIQVWNASMTGAGTPLRVRRTLVSADLFETLGVNARLGRTFAAGEDLEGAAPVVVISHGLWESSFGADPEAIGRTVEINGDPLQVVGVLPDGFRLPPFDAQVWQPLVFSPDALNSRGRNNLWLIGRIAQGISQEVAAQEMRSIGDGLAERHPAANEGSSIEIRPVREFALGSSPDSLRLLLGSVGFLLLIACANVANLTAARGQERQHELAVRVALGAGRGRLISHMLSESLVLAVIGGIVGVGVAYVAVDPLMALLPPNLGVFGEVGIDRSVLGFAFLLACLTGLASGIWPALRLSDAARGGRKKNAGGFLRRRDGGSSTRSGLVVVEFALAMTLLVAAGMFGRSLLSLYSVDLGIETEGVTSFNVTLPLAGYPTPEVTRSGVDGVLNGLSGLPGVTRVAAISHLPLTRSGLSSSVILEGHAVDQSVNAPSTGIRVVTPEYFDLMEIPLLEGRLLGPADRDGSEMVAVISQAAAETWWPGESAIGKWLWVARDGDGQPIQRTVVGVVGDVRRAGPENPTSPEMYQPHQQTTEIWRWFGRSMFFVAERSTGPLAADEIRGVLASVDPNLPVAGVETLSAALDRTIASPRSNGLLVGLFATVAMALAGIGIYGVMAYSVRTKKRELGLRMAIGARKEQVVSEIVKAGLRLAGIGAVFGLGGSFLVARFIRAMLHDAPQFDVVTYGGVAIVLTLTAVLACLLPALRAARTDPAVTLRGE